MFDRFSADSVEQQVAVIAESSVSAQAVGDGTDGFRVLIGDAGSIRLLVADEVLSLQAVSFAPGWTHTITDQNAVVVMFAADSVNVLTADADLVDGLVRVTVTNAVGADDVRYFTPAGDVANAPGVTPIAITPTPTIPPIPTAVPAQGQPAENPTATPDAGPAAVATAVPDSTPGSATLPTPTAAPLDPTAVPTFAPSGDGDDDDHGDDDDDDDDDHDDDDDDDDDDDKDKDKDDKDDKDKDKDDKDEDDRDEDDGGNGNGNGNGKDKTKSNNGIGHAYAYGHDKDQGQGQDKDKGKGR